MPHSLLLPARIDVASACTLWDQITHTEGDLLLDATQLEHIGAAGLQVLLAARQRQHNRGHSFTLVDAGQDCLTRLAQLGAAEMIPCVASGDLP